MHPSLRIGVGAIALGLTVAAVHPTAAFAAPETDKLHNASDSFEAGAKAFKAKKYEEAAAFFEAADDAVPGAKALRLAIRARNEAGQSARAATLAALALDLYASDSETNKVAQDIIDKLAPSLHKVKVSCVAPCLLAAGTTPIHGQPSTHWVIYLEPGKTSVGATFFGNVAAPEQKLFAAPGGSSDFKFEPPKDGVVAPPTKLPEKSPDQPPVKVPEKGPDPNENPDTPPPKKHFGAHPALFFVGLGATVALGATTVWSGIDAKNNPGVDKVKADCAGKGITCPTYQEGIAHQTRTNVLIGVTAGTAAITLVIGAFLTNWHGKDKAAETDKPPSDPDATKSDPAKAQIPPRRKQAIVDPRLWVDVLGARDAGVADLAPGGAVLGLQGRF